MKQHKPATIAKAQWTYGPWAQVQTVQQDIEVCEDCGMILTIAVSKMPCPPWETCERGDTPKPGSHVGAGEVNMLKSIEESLLLNSKLSMPPSLGALKALRQLIATLEGRDR